MTRIVFFPSPEIFLHNPGEILNRMVHLHDRLMNVPFLIHKIKGHVHFSAHHMSRQARIFLRLRL